MGLLFLQGTTPTNVAHRGFYKDKVGLLMQGPGMGSQCPGNQVARAALQLLRAEAQGMDEQHWGLQYLTPRGNRDVWAAPGPSQSSQCHGHQQLGCPIHQSHGRCPHPPLTPTAGASVQKA